MRLDPHHTASTALVVRAALGDPASLDRLLREIQQPLYDHIAFVMGDGDAASDVLQEVLLNVCRSLIGLQDPLLFRAWVFRIGTRAALTALRRAGRAASIPLDAALDLPTDLAEEPTFDTGLIAALPALVAELPPACGVVVRLRYLEELSIAEVAEALSLPPGTVKSRAAYGVALLRQHLAAVPR